MPVPPDSKGSARHHKGRPEDGPSGAHHADARPATPTTLATARLPRRVRDVLEQLLSMVSEELARQLALMLDDFEQQLFRLADHARNPSLQSVHLDTLRTLRLNRADLIPSYLVGLESGLAGIRDGGPGGAHGGARDLPFRSLSLVDDQDLDEDALVAEIALRHEARASLALHLLGQRFGVLAGTPAFDAERLPVGPRALCEVLRRASRTLQIGLEPRLLLFRTFDRQVMQHHAQLADMMNALLAKGQVLPSLAFVPFRARPRAQQVEAPAPADAPREEQAAPPPRRRDGGATGTRTLLSRDGRDAQRPHTGWFGESDPASGDFDEKAAFALLQQLLSGRRELLGKLRPETGGRERTPLPTGDVVRNLGAVRRRPSRSAGSEGITEIRQAVLAQARQQVGGAASLSREDSDTFELLGMLFGQIDREVRKDATARRLVADLQAPLLSVALRDRAFFVRPQHPARQLLNIVAESGATWMTDDDIDPQLANHIERAVDHVVRHGAEDPAAFEDANRELQDQLQLVARRAEVSERRHVEAARGKEKLALAKRRAAEVIEGAVRDQRLPKFVRALLNQAWADVLTLTILRHGEDSEEWKRQLEATSKIVATAGRDGAQPDPRLAGQIEGALVQVGYHVDEASAIAGRLATGLGEDEDDPASRTELAMKLKARARLGEETVVAKAKLPPRSAQEQAAYDHLRTLPFGTWFEFTTNQQGDWVRRRLSWYSPVTDNALFVNHRGQRVAEHSLDQLSRMVARGQAKVVNADRGRMIDRAWHGALNALRSFASSGRTAEAAP
ncbi:DUF1631 domain-containing protein [Luteimonas pelagia]